MDTNYSIEQLKSFTYENIADLNLDYMQYCLRDILNLPTLQIRHYYNCNDISGFKLKIQFVYYFDDFPLTTFTKIGDTLYDIGLAMQEDYRIVSPEAILSSQDNELENIIGLMDTIQDKIRLLRPLNAKEVLKLFSSLNNIAILVNDKNLALTKEDNNE